MCDDASPAGTQCTLCFLIGPVCNWLPIYELSNLVHFTIKIQKLLTVYSYLNNVIRKITCLFILWLNNFFRSHVLITLFDGFCLTLSSIAVMKQSAFKSKLSKILKEKYLKEWYSAKQAYSVGKSFWF